jgi:Lipase (class 3)
MKNNKNKNLVLTSLFTTLCVLSSGKISWSQDAGFKQPDLILKGENGQPISNSLNIESCKSNFKLCADVMESANTIPIVYNGNRTPEQAKQDAISKLSTTENCDQKQRCYTDANWDKGYKQNDVNFINEKTVVQANTGNQEKIEVDLQAVLASKRYEEGGKVKNKFLITIRGTEGFTSVKTDLAALKGSVNINDGSDANVPRGFGDSAYVLTENQAYKDLLVKIKKASDDGEDFEVLVTGHSLGGAIATTIKAIIENKLDEKDKNRVKAITFGSPPAGNKEFNERYGKNVTAIRIDGDPVPLSPVPDSQIIGTQYEFKISDAQRKVNGKWLDPSTYRFGILGIIGQIYNSGKTALIDTHASGYNDSDIANYSPALSTGVYDLRSELMQKNLTNITLGGSSPIGSASYYLGKSPNQDGIDISKADRVDLFDGSRIISAQEREQYTTPAGSITNLVAPVDVVLNWNQSFAAGQLDLDSHLTGPAGLGDDSSVRFHTYWESKGSSTTAPYVLLYRDVIPANGGSGAEQTRIQVLQNGVYRFYVHDYTNRDTINSTALSQSGANVTVYNFGKDIPTEGQNLGTPLGNAINVPLNQQGNVWRAFELDSRTGVLKPVLNAPFGNISTPSSVPSVR